MVFAWTSYDAGSVSLDARARWLSRLPSQRVDVNHEVGAYSELDARVSWRPLALLEVALVGQNLLAPHHAEFGGATSGQVERAGYAEARWHW
jgi:hypothetical protein